MFATSSADLVTTIPLAFQPGSVAVNEATGRIYVADYFGGRVITIDGSTLTETASVEVGYQPTTLAVDGQTGSVLVSSPFDNTVALLNASGTSVLATLDVPNAPSGIAVSPTTGDIFVTNVAGGTISRVEPCSVIPDTTGRATVDQPDDVSGPQVHVVYALPSDGVDRSLDVDGTLAESVGSFQAWLEDQTGGRSLRLDTYQGELDVTFIQLSRTDQEMRGDEDPFVRTRIEEELDAAGFDDPDKLYAVYYDGSSGFSCGGGAWPPTLEGNVGAMYLLGEPPNAPPCSSNAFRLANEYPGYLEFGMLHELLHTLGFVADCAPNHHRAGHVTGPTNDLMYAGDDPWDLFGVVLDDGGDDYYSHDNGGCRTSRTAVPHCRRPTRQRRNPGCAGSGSWKRVR